MNTSACRRSAVAGAAAIVGGVISAVSATPAVAAETCGSTAPAATLIAPGVCEVVMTESGAFAAPAGIAKLSALVVGAGGGASHFQACNYGGGGGEVVYVDEVALSGPAMVTIGRGSPADSRLDGEPTLLGTVESRGGQAAYGAASGNGNPAGSPNGDYSGGGGAAAAGEVSQDPNVPARGGAGFLPSAVPGADAALFPLIAGEAALGEGGTGSGRSDDVSDPGFGGGASGDADGLTRSGDGVVIFRYAALDDGTAVAADVDTPAAPASQPAGPRLAETGVEADGIAAGAVGAALLGAAALVLGRRRTRRGAR